MTKDELLATKCSAQLSLSDITYVTFNDLEKFFEANVCIPKGTNPHIDAEELHKWVEDPTMKVLRIADDGVIHPTYNIQTNPVLKKTYIVKKDPAIVYEWQFVIIDKGFASITVRF
jgi:hypothetical protein